MENSMILYGKYSGYKSIFDLASGNDVNSAVAEIVSAAEKYSLSGNIFKAYLSLLIINDENAFSLACEKRDMPTGGIYQIALNDIKALRGLFNCDLAKDCVLNVLENYALCGGEKDTADYAIGQMALGLAKELDEAKSDEAFIKIIAKFYQDFGAGAFGINKAFVIKETAGGFELAPVTKFSNITLDDLWGYETQKKQLCDNTVDFVEGRSANNCLLYGAAGTGKSSSIKAILNEYWGKGLRIIDVNKYQFKYLSAVIDSLKDRNYRFIVYIDDLSFEDFEIEYKFLKSVIEGGIQPKPENVLIYATSNRRHLIKETWSDRNDTQADIHHSDTVQEKLSLAERFGVAISFMKPIQKEYQQIVIHLAKRANINMPEDELLDRARVWELRHGGMSGRIARQFIDSLSAYTKDE
ncbi:MAG: ATP-binding protein [Clostridia bacterium]|nr:ATP-binding protein [Clostridia bacterium]